MIKTGRVDLKFLCGLLNSRLMTFWLRNRGKMQGNNFQIDKEPLEGIPIATGDAEIRKEIAGKVADIYETEGSEAIEDEIDALVYRLYGLTESEVDLVEREL